MFSDVFGGYYIGKEYSEGPDKILKTNTIGFDGGTVWISSYIGEYINPIEADSKNPVKLDGNFI
jgi:hypothetical protein